jgi:Na+/proline symporter
MDLVLWQWVIMVGVSLVLFFISPWAKKTEDFFSGANDQKPTNGFFLTSSLVIGWLFAKSLTNAGDLGYKYGIIGSLSYAVYYLSFIVAGIVIYRMRVKGGFQSIHHFLQTKYGRGSIVLFTILIGIRLLNEIWSNTIIIGSYFGEFGSIGYLSAVVIFTILTLAYTLKGGMRSSLLTDVIQMMLFVVLLSYLLWMIIPETTEGVSAFVTSGTWSMDYGLNLMFVAFIQILSYPFHDPVMTDRGFITNTKTTLHSYIWAGTIGVICIVLFSFVGIYGAMKGLDSPVISQVSKLFGTGFLLVINTIMLTSAASTIDSTFTSSTKLVHIDLMHGKNLTINKARWTMIIIAIAGTIPLLFNPDILSATTISGTFVLGLAPIFIFWSKEMPKSSFFASVGCGIFFGIWMILFPIPDFMVISNGPYGDLLSINFYGTVMCFILFFTPYLFKKYVGKQAIR